MDDVVINAVPPNISGEEAALLMQWERYSLPALKVRRLRNVFVNHYGLCVRNGLLVPACAPNLRGHSDKTFWWKYQKLALEQYLVCRFGKSLKSKRLSGDEFLVIHFPWFNYFFWFTECIPRLKRALSVNPQAILIYPEIWDRFPFVAESLSVFENLRTERIPADYHLFADQLLMPETRPWSGSMYPEWVRKVRETYHEFAARSVAQSPYGDRIYISRRKTGRRTLVNETEIETLLSENGFTPVFMEDHSFAEQVAIMKDTRVLISMHGAGMANINFMPEGSAVLEFVNKAYAKVEYTFTFWRLGCAAGLKYYMQFCDHQHDPSEPLLQNMNLYADKEKLKAHLATILNNT